MKERTHLSLAPQARRDLKVLAARHGVAPGDALAALVALAETLPAATLARAMARHDSAEGTLVPDGPAMVGHLEQARLGIDPESL